MANRAIVEEEIQLKKRARRRLVGAVVLVLLVVVFVPLLLNDQPKQPPKNVSISMPDHAPGQANRSSISPVVPEPAAPQSIPNDKPDEKIAGDAVQSKPPAENVIIPQYDPESPSNPVVPPKAAVVKPRSEPAPSKPAEPRRSTAPATGNYVIQLGAFSAEANAKQLQKKLTKEGIQSYTETLKTDSGTKIRVRAGPFASREEADRVRAKLQMLDVSGVVVSDK